MYDGTRPKKLVFISNFPSIQFRHTWARQTFDILFYYQGPSFIETTWSLTGRGRRPMKSQIIESPLPYTVQPLYSCEFHNSTNINSGSNPVHYLRSLSDVSNYVRSLCVYESDLYAGSNKLISIWNIDTMKIKRQITIPGEVFTLHIIKGMSHTYNALLMSHI